MGDAQAIYEKIDGDKKVQLIITFSSNTNGTRWAEKMVEETVQKWDKELKSFIKIL